MAKDKANPCRTCNGHGALSINARTGKYVGCDWRNPDAKICDDCTGTGEAE